MKTTIDIADGLLMEAKERARRDRTTLRALIEEGLRTVLKRTPSHGEYRWEPITYGGPDDPVTHEDIEKALREARKGRRFPEFGDPPVGVDW